MLPAVSYHDPLGSFENGIWWPHLTVDLIQLTVYQVCRDRVLFISCLVTELRVSLYALWKASGGSRLSVS
jgi:hypothetical protein